MSVSKIEEIRAARPATKEITSPVTGFTYRIRRLAALEFEELGIETIMSLDLDTMKPRGEVEARLDTQKMLAAAKQTVRMATVEPGISLTELDKPGVLHISEIAPDDTWLFREIISFSGLDQVNQASVKKFAGNGSGPDSSTPSPGVTEGSPTSS